MRYLFHVCLLVFAFSFTIPTYSQTKCYPRNDVYKDSSLTTFVCKLQYAIFKKDKNYLLSLVDKDIKNGFGGNDGIEEFKKIWGFDKGNDSHIWYYLSKLISMGGILSEYKDGNTVQKNVVFPYVFEMSFPESAELDAFTVMAITGESVNVREKPDKTSKSLGQLTYDVVKVDYDKSYPPFAPPKIENLNYYGEKEWYYVTTLDKKLSGYVNWEYVWSPVSYRMFLAKKNGKWIITMLLEGD